MTVLQRLGLLKPAFRAYELLKGVGLGVWRTNRDYRRTAPPDDLPLPSRWLLMKVSGTANLYSYRDGGEQAARAILNSLGRNNLDIRQFESILDFGCGAGRVLRQWKHLPGIHGTDYNPQLVRWCQRHLPFAQVTENRLEPPLPHSTGQFGFIYALSVFTHLPEPAQQAWMVELERVLRPGGYLLFSTHGEYYLPRLSARERELFRAGKLVVRFGTGAGSNLCNVMHPYSYVCQELAHRLDLVDFAPEGALGNPRQDLYLFRKRD